MLVLSTTLSKVVYFQGHQKQTKSWTANSGCGVGSYDDPLGSFATANLKFTKFRDGDIGGRGLETPQFQEDANTAKHVPLSHKFTSECERFASESERVTNIRVYERC